MSVAERTETARSPVSTRLQLGFSSLVGGVLLLAALWIVFGGLPNVWDQVSGIRNVFLSGALQLIASLVLVVALSYAAYQLERSHNLHGLRAGVFVAAILLYLTAWLTVAVIGQFLTTRELDPAVGLSIIFAIGAGLLFVVFKVFTSSGFSSWLLRLEEQGWFHAVPYKPTQGVRVRRGTVLAILTVGICGIITLVSHGSLSDGYTPNAFYENTWFWMVPFAPAGYEYLPLMYMINVLLPVLLAVVLLWLAWRVVNWPTFADFLIATEAEMNKVSWTSKKRLVQDTIVVLTTVFLMTVFLFVVDILWIKILSWGPIGVLQVDVRSEALKQQEKTQW